MSSGSWRKPRSSGCEVIKHWLIMAALSVAADLTGSFFQDWNASLLSQWEEILQLLSLFQAEDSVKRRDCTPSAEWTLLCTLLNILILSPFCWGNESQQRNSRFLRNTESSVWLCLSSQAAWKLHQTKQSACLPRNETLWCVTVLYDFTWQFYTHTHSLEFFFCISSRT